MERGRNVLSCALFTYCSRQITLATGCARGCSSSLEMAERSLSLPVSGSQNALLSTPVRFTMQPC
jgi:hypothetical protein